VFDENLSIINENSIESNIRGKVEDCLLVNVWKKINESINTMLDSITLKDLVQEYNNSNDRQLIC
jgi:DNA-binding IscR family transcriptional regulator